jgi:hypothetical protein
MTKIIKQYILVFALFASPLSFASIQGRNLPCHSTPYLSSNTPHFDIAKDVKMNHNSDPPNCRPINDYSQFKSFGANEKLLEIEEQLRKRHLLYEPEVQWLIEKAAFGAKTTSEWVIKNLESILKAESIEDMRTGNVWGPMGPQQLLNCGNLHLYDQMNGIEWKIPLNALTRGMLLTGPQGGGKSRFLIWLTKQLNSFSIPFFLLDPKLGLKDWAGYLNAEYVNVDDISIDLSPPLGLTYEQFLPALMPHIGDVLGLIYGDDILQDAAQICIDLRNQYIQKTDKNTEISLLDIYQAVPFVKDVSKGRRLGYREAVSTSLGRLLTGSGNLFKCRRGVDLRVLFNHNVILGCRSITDHFAAKFLAVFLLYWLYESERFSPPCDNLKRTVILDDSTNYLSVRAGFDTTSHTSILTEIYSRLRSSGNGVIATTQIPHLADPGIVALSHTAINVGGLHYGKDTQLLADVMGLDDQQRQHISKLAQREAIGISGGTAYSGLVHGRICDVPDIVAGGRNA